MAHSDPLPQSVLDILVIEIGRRIEPVLNLPLQGVEPSLEWKSQPVQLAEHFAVWMIGLDNLSRVQKDIGELAVQTGLWHHQVRVGGKATVFARSRPLGPSDWSIEDVTKSPIAEKIDSAVDWIDSNVPGDPLVR